jgi:hypothetical protein
MRQAIIESAAVLLTALVCNLGVHAQDFQFRVGGAWGRGGDYRPDRRYSGLEMRLAEGALDPEAQAILQASTRFTKRLFSVPSLDLRRAISYRDGSGDILLVEWNIEEPFGQGSVIVEDTPFVSAYALCLRDCRVSTQEELKALLSALLADGWMRGVPIHVSPGAVIQGFAGKTMTSSVDLLHDLELVGYASADAWYLTLQVGKSHSRADYPVPPFVPERFPPLAELIETWTASQIRIEVGRQAGPTPDFQLPEPRDRVLITELARRGLTTEEIVDLLGSAPPGRLRSRVGTVIAALHAAGNTVPLSSYIGPAIERYRQIGPKADLAVEALFNFAKAGCSQWEPEKIDKALREGTPVFEEQAIKALREGMFVRGPRTYLSVCSASEEGLAAVAGMKGNSRDKQSAIDSIRHRIDKGKARSK